jgi:UDP-N-acetylglucosamine 2-epimerase (non-hydrolysing)
MNPAIFIREEFFEDIAKISQSYVHVVLIATKPDIIKQAPVYLELKRRGEPVVLCHTGQHYDFNLSGGLQEEFGIVPDVNLNIQGSLHSKIAQIIERFGDVVTEIQKLGKVVVPYTHGDTTTSMAAANGAFACGAAVVHVEAGIRTLTPKKEVYDRFLADFKAGSFSFHDYRTALMERANYERGSIEPFPEQFNTRCTEPATGLFCAPCELDAEFLLSEGYPTERIKVVGNTVADAMKITEKQSENSKIFETYPLLKEGKFVRFCIHRRENTQNKERFSVLFKAIETMVRRGDHVLLISLFATESAIDAFGFRETVTELSENFPNFIYSPVWPYYTDVIAAMKRAACCATDSGSMQEEMNILGIPCVTLRFGSDRAETFLAGCNVPAPPVDSDFIVKIIEEAVKDPTLKNQKNLYGTDVAKLIVDETLALLKRDGKLIRFEG